MAKRVSDKITTGQRPYPKVLRHPSPIEYQTLILALAKSAQRVDDGGDALSEAYVSLHRIFEFINLDSQAQASIMSGPLNQLANALYDVSQGASPSLFTTAKKRGRPTNLASRELPRAYIAGTLGLLIECGEGQKPAAEWVVQTCGQLGIKVGGEKISVERLSRWREDLTGQQKAAAQAQKLYRHVRDRRMPGFIPRGLALLWLEFVARHFP